MPRPPLVNTIEQSSSEPFETFNGGRAFAHYRYKSRYPRRTPDYYKYILSGAMPPPLPFSNRSGYTIAPPCEVINHRTGKVVGVSQVTQQLGPDSSDSRAAAIRRAEAEASRQWYSKLSKQNSFNLGVALAEMKETGNLIVTTATRLSVAYRHLRKGGVKDAMNVLGISSSSKVKGLRGVPANTPDHWTADHHRRHLERRRPKADRMDKFAANSWLELQYGWTPLLLDVHGAAQHVAKTLHASDYDIYLSGHGSASTSWSKSNPNGKGSGMAHAKVGYFSYLKVTDPALRQSASLGLTNPLLIAWEKVPFSFVFDWFYPVGDMLESLTLMQGFSVKSSCTSRKVQRSSQFNAEPSRLGTYGYRGYSRSFSEEFERTLGSPPIRMPKFSLYENLSWKRVTSALALARQLTLR